MCRRFEIINPTSSGYEFRWTDDSSLTNGSPFKCITPRGYVEGGKKYEVLYYSTYGMIVSICCYRHVNTVKPALKTTCHFSIYTTSQFCYVPIVLLLDLCELKPCFCGSEMVTAIDRFHCKISLSVFFPGQGSLSVFFIQIPLVGVAKMLS